MSMKMIRTFKFEGSDTRYVVSEDGEIQNISTGRMLKPYTDNAGYLTTNVTINGVVYKLKHHLVVNELFNKPRPKGFVVNHIDHNKANNHYSNLEVISYSGNTKAWHEFTKNKKLSEMVDNILDVNFAEEDDDFVLSQIRKED